MATQEESDFESFKKMASASLYSGKKTTGHDGVFSSDNEPLLEAMILFEGNVNTLKRSKTDYDRSSLNILERRLVLSPS